MYTDTKWIEYAKDGGVTWEVFEKISLAYVSRATNNRIPSESLRDCLQEGFVNYLGTLGSAECPKPETERFTVDFCAGTFQAFVREVARLRMLWTRRPKEEELSDSGDLEAKNYRFETAASGPANDLQLVIGILPEEKRQILGLTLVAFKLAPNQPAWEFVAAILHISRSTYFLRLRRALETVRNRLADMDHG